MEHEYLLLKVPGSLIIESPNVDCEVFKGSKEEIEGLFSEAMLDVESGMALFVARIVLSAEPTYVVTNLGDDDEA